MVTFACVCARPRLHGKRNEKEKQRNGHEPSTSAAQSSQSSQTTSNKELRRLYDKLQKKHEREGEPLRNLQQQNQELSGELEDKERDLEESTADNEELVNLVRTRDEAIKTLQNKLANAKKTIDRAGDASQKPKRRPANRGVQIELVRTALPESTSATRKSCIF